MLQMRRWSFGRPALEHLHRTTASHAAKLSIFINQSLGDRLHLPERLIAALGAYSATLYFTLQKHLSLNCHNAPRQPGCVSWSRSFRCHAHGEQSALLPNSIDRMSRSL